MKESHLRKVNVTDMDLDPNSSDFGIIEDVKVAYFHRWIELPFSIPDGKGIVKVGLVKQQDGTMNVYPPKNIQFTN